MRVLSIDVGTSNTVAVLAVPGQQPRVVEVDGAATMPSAVYADEDGVILVGRDAERQARMDPTRFEPTPKRRIDDGALLLGGSVVPVTDALAAVLRRVLDETVRQLGGALPDEFRLTHPANWGAARRNTLMSAGRLAGMTGNIVMVPEPVAAAAHFNRLAPGSSLAVYDLGSGTFDVAVVAATPGGFTVQASDGLADLGGTDMDQLLLEYVGRQVSNRDAARWQQLLRPESTADRRAQRALVEDVRAAKEALSRHPQTVVPMPEPFADVTVTRPELEALIRPSLTRSIELLSSTIAASGVHPMSLAGIYLVGGASRMPLVGALIGERLRVAPVSLDQPETAVASGAHLVPRDGVTIRTQVSAPSSPRYPTTGDFMAGAQFPQLAGPAPAPASKGASKATMVALGAIVLVALVVLGGFLVASPSRFPSAADCSGTPGSPDGKGFTNCTRQLAGPVADQGDCQAGYDGSGVAVTGLASVTCHIDGRTVVYTQTASLEERDTKVHDLIGGYTNATTIRALWAGNGLRGEYWSVGVSGVGVVAFTVSDRPLVGVLTAPATADPSSLTAAKAAETFEHSVQPGT
ncbi:Hsp70 family protein [Kutzneria chonburiensis]|uniref:Hsp70 family protein n=1 Tax=Kutzneria chonburiensis TaxID=1483604 RepID=A0ABV6MZ01_9PSEU|nr:Hsp70 family protein [Kutzneria chonburiensis]